MKASELWQMILRYERDFDKRQTIRNIKTILGYALAFLALLHMCGVMRGISLVGFLALVVACLIGSLILFVVNCTVFYWLITRKQAEEEIIKKLKKRYQEAQEKEKGSGKNDSVPKE
jgi:hypothetical protein